LLLTKIARLPKSAEKSRRWMFQFVNPAYANKGSAVDGTDSDNIQLIINSAKGSNTTTIIPINAWSAYGPDYNFFFFINCPSLYGVSVPSGV
jgi:hypothetical protein